jgi:copper chaperone
METITLTAPDISCAHCEATIEREVGGMEGVQAVSVDTPTRQVEVSFNPSRVLEGDIIARLDEEGYPVAG